MTWELGYAYGLASGGAAVGLIGLFVHAGFWERWGRLTAELRGQRDDNYRVAEAERKDADAARRERDEREALMICYRRERDAAAQSLLNCVSDCEELEADLDEAEYLRRRAIDRAGRAIDVATRVTAERDAALAKADAFGARCHQAVTDRRTAYDGLSAVVRLIEATRKGCS